MEMARMIFLKTYTLELILKRYKNAKTKKGRNFLLRETGNQEKYYCQCVRGKM
jgi:hypothetical protein